MLVIQIPVRKQLIRNSNGELHERLRVVPTFWRAKHEDNDVLASPVQSNDPGILIGSLFDEAFRNTFSDVDPTEDVYVELAEVPAENGVEDDRPVMATIRSY